MLLPRNTNNKRPEKVNSTTALCSSAANTGRPMPKPKPLPKLSASDLRPEFSVWLNLDFMRMVLRVIQAERMDADSLEQGRLSPSIRADEAEIYRLAQVLIRRGVRKALLPDWGTGPVRANQRKIVAKFRGRLKIKRAKGLGMSDHIDRWLSAWDLYVRNAELSASMLRELLFLSDISPDELPGELSPMATVTSRLVFAVGRLAPIWSEVADKPMLGEPGDKLDWLNAMLLYLLLEEPQRLQLLLDISDEFGDDMRLALANEDVAEMLFVLADRVNLVVNREGLEPVIGRLDPQDSEAVLKRICGSFHHIEHVFWLREIFHEFVPDIEHVLMVCA